MTITATVDIDVDTTRLAAIRSQINELKSELDRLAAEIDERHVRQKKIRSESRRLCDEYANLSGYAAVSLVAAW